jgi:hypothetical protein
MFVYVGDEMIAQQKNYDGTEQVRWNYRNPVTRNQRGAVETELDPFGRNMALYEMTDPPITPESGLLNPGRYTDALEGRFGCTIDGAPSSCDQAYDLLGSGELSFADRQFR